MGLLDKVEGSEMKSDKSLKKIIKQTPNKKKVKESRTKTSIGIVTNKYFAIKLFINEENRKRLERGEKDDYCLNSITDELFDKFILEKKIDVK